MRNNKIYSLSMVVIAAMLVFTGCSKKEGCTDPDSLNYDSRAEVDNGTCEYPNQLIIPETFNFTNVSYGGQTVRLLLLQELISKIGAAGTTITTEDELLDLFEKNNEELGLHSDISTGKNLSGKFLASAANSGLSSQWKDSVRVWFQQIAGLSADGKAPVRADGVDLKQAVEKTLMGGILYDQATNHYLNLIIGDDNAEVIEGKGTEMQHHWDEAFGYFGAPRDYNKFTDAEIKGQGERDSNGDGRIDPNSEKCFYYSQTAAKRDLGTMELNGDDVTDYSKEIFDAWLKGRAAISDADYSARDEAVTSIRKNWESIIAATVVHYINETIADLNSSGSDLNKHWSEMYYYCLMLKFNPNNVLGSNLTAVMGLFGANPSSVDVTSLENAKAMFKTPYGFSDYQLSNW